MISGKLFLLPVDKTFEMRRLLPSSSQIQSANSSLDGQLLDPTACTPAQLAPVRIRFARLESELQRHRREQSALFNQRQIDADLEKDQRLAVRHRPGSAVVPERLDELDQRPER